MKVRRIIGAIGLATLLSFSAGACAEFYVVEGGVPCPTRVYHKKRHVRHYQPRRHYTPRRHQYLDWWERRHRNCYDPDLTTGDDDPCIHPDMDINE